MKTSKIAPNKLQNSVSNDEADEKWCWKREERTEEDNINARNTLKKSFSDCTLVNRTDNKYFSSALQCNRMRVRRGALADPEKMAMDQETREQVEKERDMRKKSFPNKLSYYLKTLLNSDELEVDLT
ncbi:unnamed protein product [Dimorphilus gyrociliatus]|uniref:Uncharacterized protein n=1 Tax=Dimorphilus gyrociliatus TaxID=2664684 RepID=A0A7I8W3A6_9ANNE|nr:unnamed protein product [Dimorphilus gyrociliatus]